MDKGALIPRPETEELVSLAIEYARGLKEKKIKILDFGTGSGCIALALAKEIKNCQVLAVDKSKLALKCAEKNINALAFQKKIRLKRADRLSGLSGKFDLIVSNPPYIPSRIIRNLDREVQFEPKMALDGGADGLKIVKEIIKDAPGILKPGGRIFFEMEENQSGLVLAVVNRKIYGEIFFHKDYNKKTRFAELGLC